MRKRKMVPEVKHGSTLLMGAANAQILYAMICYPKTLHVIRVFVPSTRCDDRR